MLSSLPAAASARLPEMVELRRRLHRCPEVGLDLPRTRSLILDAIDGLELDVRLHVRTSGVVAIMNGRDVDGPVTLLRADNDGLPLTEHTSLQFASETGSTMHACGHDLHTAMLVGAARILHERREHLPGPVVLMFQPGEEGHHGAKVMLEEGLLEAAGRRPSRAFAIHVFTSLANGVVGLRPGVLMAASDQFHITLKGEGGHASSPHLAVDPVPAAAEIILAVQAATTRVVPVLDPVVVTFGHVEAGSAPNIIPERVYLHGTIRSLSDRSRDLAHQVVTRVVAGVAAAHGIDADVRIAPGYPITRNDPERSRRTRELAIEMLGEGMVVDLPDPMMVAEDWSYVLNEVPGVMALVGARPEDVDPASSPMNHSDRVIFDEGAMINGAALYAAAALDSGAAQAAQNS